MFETDDLIFNQVIDKMVVNINTFGMAVLDWVFRDFYGTHVFTVENHGRLRYIIFVQHLFHLEKLQAATTCSNILNFYS